MTKTVKGQFLFLGTGGSLGIPVVGCRCHVCRSTSPFNQRLRPSGLVTVGKRRFLIDCGPDFRQQALRYDLDTLDGILFTHSHQDHIAGVDELRIYRTRSKKALSCLLSEATAVDLKTRYPYIFNGGGHEKLTAKLDLQLLEGRQGVTTFEGLRIGYVSYEQAGMQVNGFRFGNFAYLSDVSHYSDEIFSELVGVEILVVSALRFTTSQFHLSVDQAVAFAERVGAKQAWLTHIAHELEHEATNRYLPAHVRMAFDGLEFPILIEEA